MKTSRQQGFGAIAAIIVLVLLAALATAIVSLTATQQTTIVQDALSAKANLAARAGTEWGLYQAFNGPAGYCANAPLGGALPPPTTLPSLPAITGMQVTVWCRSSPYNEGESVPGEPRTVRVYQILAIACSALPCPGDASNVASPAYVERRHEVVAVK